MLPGTATKSYLHHDPRMIQPFGRICEAGQHVFTFEIGQFLQDVTRRQAAGEQIKHVDDTNAHSSNARFAAASLRVKGDSLVEVHIGDLTSLSHSSINSLNRLVDQSEPLLSARQNRRGWWILPGSVHKTPFLALARLVTLFNADGKSKQ